MKTQVTIQNAVVLLLISIAVISFPSRASAVEFETIRSNMKNKTSVACDDYSNSLKGQLITWTGWVVDVKEQRNGGFKVLIDMDSSRSSSQQDVYIEILDKSLAIQFSKGQKVRFYGRIKSVMSVLGSCTVTIEDASIFHGSL